MLGTLRTRLRARPPVRPGHRYHRQVRTVVVGLAPDTDPRLLPELAATKLRMRGMTANGSVLHFLTRTRRTNKLIDRWHGITSGGPIRLLDLDRMRCTAAAAAAAQWQLWHHVTAGTKPAQPFWAFADRHHGDPHRYPLPRAQADYLAQPRVIAMSVYNALPHRVCDLPTADLEAFQAGYDTYLNLAWLAAVPADGLAPAHGDGWLTATSGRLTDQLTLPAGRQPSPGRPAPRRAAHRDGDPRLTGRRLRALHQHRKGESHHASRTVRDGHPLYLDHPHGARLVRLGHPGPYRQRRGGTAGGRAWPRSAGRTPSHFQPARRTRRASHQRLWRPNSRSRTPTR